MKKTNKQKVKSVRATFSLDASTLAGLHWLIGQHVADSASGVIRFLVREQIKKQQSKVGDVTGG